MQNRVVQRPINTKLEKKGSYALAAGWLRLVRSEKRWESGKQFAGWASRPLGALTGVFVDWKAGRREAIADVFFPRFDSMFKEVLISSGCAKDKVKEETTKCHLKLINMVNADPEYRCLPELMWRSCADFWNVPSAFEMRFHVRFHLRALLDELPTSDERGALRDFVFGDDDERARRKSAGEDLSVTYSQGRRDEVERGLELFTEYLYKKRGKVPELTANVISSGMLSTRDDAEDLVMNNIGVKQRREHK